MTQLSSQLDPVQPKRRGLGAGGGGSQELRPSVGQVVSAQAVSGGMLSIYVPSIGQPVTATYVGGVQVAVPLSCPDPCQFILDGTTGTITLTWVDATGHSQSVIVHIVANASPTPPPPPAPPPKLVVPIVGRGPLRPNLPISLTTAGASTPTSTGTKVAVGAAAVTGVSLVTVAIVSAVTGWGITKTLDRAWDKITGKKPSRR